MKLPFSINGKEVLIASSWEDLSVGQTIDLLRWAESEKKELPELASIVSEIPKDELLDYPFEFVSKIAAPAYNFILTTKIDKDDWDCPKEFECGGALHKRDFDAGFIQFGCMEIFEKTISTDATNFTEKIPLMIASMIYKGKFSGREQEARKEIEAIANDQVMKMPIYIAHPIAVFFLLKLTSLAEKQTHQVMDIPKLKSKLEFKSWRSLVNSARFIRSQKATH